MFHLIAWIQSKYYNHQFLKSLPDDYNDESKIGPFSMDGKEYTIHIYGREGHKPRFHILDKDNNDICSIYLMKAKYFGANTRDLNSKEIEDLNKYLAEINKYGITKWTELCMLWESACFNKEFNYNKDMKPNYALLEKEN